MRSAAPPPNVEGVEILTCDTCRGPICDPDRAMIYWDAGADSRVSELRLAHRGPCDAAHLGLSMDLWWFATSDIALRRLAGLAYDYQWPAEQFRRLTFIAWAVTTSATPKDRKRARERHSVWMEMGL